VTGIVHNLAIAGINAYRSKLTQLSGCQTPSGIEFAIRIIMLRMPVRMSLRGRGQEVDSGVRSDRVAAHIAVRRMQRAIGEC
jgi:hypothetical protein